MQKLQKRQKTMMKNPQKKKLWSFAKKTTEWELDSDTAEQILFLGSDEKDMDFDDSDGEEIDYSESNEDKIKKATESFNINSDEKILFGYDDTLKKSFKSGLVLTEKNFILRMETLLVKILAFLWQK